MTELARKPMRPTVCALADGVWHEAFEASPTTAQLACTGEAVDCSVATLTDLIRLGERVTMCTECFPLWHEFVSRAMTCPYTHALFGLIVNGASFRSAVARIAIELSTSREEAVKVAIDLENRRTSPIFLVPK